MATRHKLRTTLAWQGRHRAVEIDCEIAFAFAPGAGASFYEYGWGHEIEFIAVARLVHGLPAPFHGPDAAQEQAKLDNLAAGWLESAEGQAAALEEVAAELQEARVFIAESRREA